MNVERLVDSYLDAWTRKDRAGVFALLHKGAAYYDAFWRETAVGRDLEQYLDDWFQIENHYYQRIGEVLPVENGVVFRYKTHDKNASGVGQVVYEGAMVLMLRDGRILTISDYYCSPYQPDLEEVAMLSIQRHGESRYTSAGLGAKRSSLLKDRLEGMVESDPLHRFPQLTVSQLAERLGCTTEQLFQVISAEIQFSDAILEHQGSD